MSNDGAHHHPSAETALANETKARQAGDATNAAAIAALTLRVTALEGPPVPPTVRPFPLPVTTQTVSVPASVNSLQSFIDGVPNGSIIAFPAGAQYVFTGDGIHLDGRSNLIFDLGTATFLNQGDPSHANFSAFPLGWGAGGNSHITFRGGTIKGSNPDGATANAYHVGRESSCGFWMARHNSYIELDHVTVTDQWGHGVYLTTNGHPGEEPDHVWVHDSTFDRMGVMGVAIACGINVDIEDNVIRDTAIVPIDYEDGQPGERMQHVHVRRNAINRWGWCPTFTARCIDAAASSHGMTWDDVEVSDNIMSGGMQNTGPNGHGSLIEFRGQDPIANLRITNNKGPANNGSCVGAIPAGSTATVSGNTP